MGMKRDVRFALSAEEKQDAIMLLKILSVKARQNPWMKPCINVKALRDAWPGVKDSWR